MRSNSKPPSIHGVFFDLDGTLVDTAPDIASAINTLRQENALPPLAYEAIRCQVSNGAAAIMNLAFGQEKRLKHQFEDLQTRFLQLYAANLLCETRLFPGFAELLEALEDRGILWGIVTNKPASLSKPIIEGLGLSKRTACLICGDLLPQKKPHPAPLLYAARTCNLETRLCCYLGDAKRDIEAGRSAHMYTLIAQWGYIDAMQNTESWGAHKTLLQPLDLLEWLDTPTNTIKPPNAIH
ncbi:HAD-IA family hydrolase [Acidihalobacter prosperus]